ncbi:MAG: hypothetical protein ABI681_11540 [Gemmatimonadales bacterium]
MIGQRPPFALATPSFRFRALASYAGRAALGGDRELALGCFVACRLGAGLTPPNNTSAPADVKARAVAARHWLASMSLPPAFRAATSAVIEAAAESDEAATARALGHLTRHVSGKLDDASMAEIRDLVTELSHDSTEL